MKTALKIVIAIVLIIVFVFVYLAFVAGTTGQAGSFLDNLWKSIESIIPF